MGRVYEINLFEAVIWSQYFFVMIKVLTYKGYYYVHCTACTAN